MPSAELNADKFANQIEDILNYLKKEMAAAQAKYKNNANYRCEPAPIFKEGDEVWLDTRNIRIKRPSRKLD